MKNVSFVKGIIAFLLLFVHYCHNNFGSSSSVKLIFVFVLWDGSGCKNHSNANVDGVAASHALETPSSATF